MPKQNLILNDFSGGLNQEREPTDIEDNQFATLTDATVNRKGAIDMMGAGVIRAGGIAAAYTNPGYGLFAFSSDYSLGSSPTEAPTDCAVMHSGNRYYVTDGSFNISTDKNGDTLQLGSTTTANVYPEHYYVDGALRISDIENTTNTNKWFGYINRTDHIGSVNGWYQQDQEIKAPTSGLVGTLKIASADGASSTTVLQETDFFKYFDADSIEDVQVAFNQNINAGYTIRTRTSSSDSEVITDALAAGTWISDPVIMLPAHNCGFNLNIISTPTGGEWEAGDYEFATTLIYDGSQESLLRPMDGNSTAVLDSDSIVVEVLPGLSYDERVTGGRIYVRDITSEGEWILFADIDLKLGCRTSLSGSYSYWSFNAFATNQYECELTSTYKNVETYEMLTGINQDETSIYAKYTTSAIANRRAYIGNVIVDDIKYGDRILRSPVGKFDTFPATSVLDVAIGDGDEIVHIEVNADKMLVFKREKLFVINVSQEYEFIENEYAGRGVPFPSCVVKTPYGVAFANEYGLFLYTGSDLVELTKNNHTTYTDIYAEDSHPSIGFITESDELLFLASAKTVGSKEVLTFSFRHNNIAKGTHKYPDYYATNFIEYDGELILLNSNDGRFYKWDITPTTSSYLSIDTKSFDFGDPFREKKVYEVFVKHNSTATPNVAVTLAEGNNVHALGSLSYTFGRPIQIDKFTYSGDAIDDAQIKLAASGTVPSNFVIDAIGITYRMKGVSKNV